MDIRITLDEKDVQLAQQLAGIADPAQLMPYVLREFVRLRSRQELLGMEGSDPEAKAPPRRRPPGFGNEEQGPPRG